MLLSIQNLTFHFGSRTLFEEVNWQINSGERIGLVGVNGAGKSTLLRIITGAYTPSGGQVIKPKDVTLGFFNQDLLSFSTNDSILQVGMQAYEKAKEIEKLMETILHQLETKPNDEKLLDDYSHALHDFEMAGGYEMEHKTAEVLEGLGFTTADLQRPYDQFSGGWRMRVLLAKMMLQAPDILLLDEPTNHLDLPSIEWLERYLVGYPGSVVIVSHDRFFLDRMVTKIVEVSQRDLIPYTGSYSFYETEKKERSIIQQRAYENQQDYIRQQERFVERFKAKASKATLAQSVVKRLEKLDRVEAPDDTVPMMNINFDVAVQPGKIITELKNISKSYGENVLLKNADAEILRGDKIALIGANGKGKSTLLRIITEHESFDGERKWGHNVEESFYAQHQLESLNVEDEILEELKHSRSGKTELELRQLLGCFLFSGDDVFKKIKVLSGGEKARVALAKVIAARSNFLLLDEPTNHLDMYSVEMLIQALNKYEGTFILVSHDRYFISRTANKIWEIVEGKIKEFVGTYDEWVDFKQREAAKALPVTPLKATPKIKVKSTLNDSEKKQLKNEFDKLNKQYKSKEQELIQYKSQLKEKEQLLADPALYANQEKFRILDQEYKTLSQKVATENTLLEQLLEQVFALEEQLNP